MATTNMIAAPALARRLVVKTGTLAKWRYLGKGPKRWFYACRNRVIYPLDAVEEHEALLKATLPVFSRPPLRGAPEAL
jgi:hypothetical protein